MFCTQKVCVNTLHLFARCVAVYIPASLSVSCNFAAQIHLDPLSCEGKWTNVRGMQTVKDLFLFFFFKETQAVVDQDREVVKFQWTFWH